MEKTLQLILVASVKERDRGKSFMTLRTEGVPERAGEELPTLRGLPLAPLQPKPRRANQSLVRPLRIKPSLASEYSESSKRG